MNPVAAVRGLEATLVLAAVNIAATYIGFRNIDTLGSRALSQLGFGGMAVFMLLGAATLLLHGTLHGTLRAVLVLVMLAGFVVFFAFGVGGAGWIIEGEYFPTEVRGRMAATVAFIDWIANFAVVQLFPVLQQGLGLAGVMVMFAVLSMLAVGFVPIWLPETKGMSVEEIAALFEHQT